MRTKLSRRNHVFLLLLACLMLSVNPALWAVEPEAPGVANFHQVNVNLYRGAQPTEEGFRSLAHLGVKTVLDLRDGGDRAEKSTVESLHMRYVHVPLHGLTAPSDARIAQALTVLQAKENGPVFVHCKRGADRTGTVIACYRITEDHWQQGKALEEAKEYGMSPLQVAMKRYILKFQAPNPLAGAGDMTASH